MIFKRIVCIIYLFSLCILQKGIAQNSDTPNTSTIMSDKLIQPPYLQSGDTVAIVAPSGILKNRDKEIKQSSALLKSWGLKVVIGEHVFNKAGHFAGTDAERTEDLQKALDDPKIKAIWIARGGYGTVRIIDELDYSKFKEHPKWLIGYSDITALHNDIHNEGVETIHALMCTSLTDDLEDIMASISTFKKAIFGTPLNYNIKGSKYNKIGKAKGQLVGGNLTLLHTMLGSSTSISTDGKIIFFEEIGEYAYHIDRMLISLKRAGYFENCKGIIVGDITKVRKNTTPWGKPVRQLILDVFAEYDFPILFDFPAGHEKDNRALILGRTVEINVQKDLSTLVYPE